MLDRIWYIPEWATANNTLAGGFKPPEKYQSVGMIVHNIWKKMFQTTNEYMYYDNPSTVMGAHVYDNSIDVVSMDDS